MASTPTTEAPAAGTKKDMTPYERFRQYVDSAMFKNDLGKLIGPAKVDRFVRVTLTATQQNPDLLTANRRTLLLACMKAASDGLLPDGKEAVFTVYNTKVKKKNDAGNEVQVWEPHAQYTPMVAGIIKKMYQARDEDGNPLVKLVSAYVVYTKDQFKYVLGDEPKITHEPYLGPDRGDITHAYVVIKLANGEILRQVMAREDIDKIRAQSKAPDSLMWKSFFDQGAIKAVMKRAYKQMPSSPEIEQVLRHDNEATGLQFEHEGGLADPMDESANPSTAVALEDQRDEQKKREIPTTASGKPVDPALAAAKANRSRKAADKPVEASLPLEGTATPPFTPAELEARLDAADSIDVLDLVAADISSCHFPDEVAKPLWAKYNELKAAAAGSDA